MKRKMTRREDYLKLIYLLSQKGKVRGADLADELKIKRPTVCVYRKCLSEIGDISMDQHHCVHLTQQGRSIASKDACAIEHNLSPVTYYALKKILEERLQQP